MKRIYSILLLAILAGTIYGQDRVRLGLHFSPNIGWIKSGDNDFESDGSSLQYSFGLHADFPLSTNYHVFSGITVMNLQGNIKAEAATADIRSRYVEVPVALKLKTNPIGYFSYFGKFGLSLGGLIDAESTVNVAGQEITDNDFQKEMQPFRSALLVGLGTEYNISGSTNLVVGIDFNSGFTGIFKKKAFDNSEFKGTSSFIALNLGVYF